MRSEVDAGCGELAFLRGDADGSAQAKALGVAFLSDPSLIQ